MSQVYIFLLLKSKTQLDDFSCHIVFFCLFIISVSQIYGIRALLSNFDFVSETEESWTGDNRTAWDYLR